MENIYLHTPIILTSMLDDMPMKHKVIALEILVHKKFVTFSETGLTFLTAKEAMETDKIYHGGSEGVCVYRQVLGLPDRSIRVIKVSEILEIAEDFDTMEDFLVLLQNVDTCNRRLIRNVNINAPSIILWSMEYDLRRAVTQLQYNPEGEDQFMKCNQAFNAENKTYYCCPIPRKSLTDIGYNLTDPELPDED